MAGTGLDNGRITDHLRRVAEPSIATKKIAILGRAPSSLHLAPFTDNAWEIWSLGNAAVSSAPSGAQKGASDIPRWDRWFELHDLDAGKERWPAEYWTWLAVDHGKTIYLGQPHPHVPHGAILPWERIFARFGRYFNNSISEMMALAILEGATELALYGVDMAQTAVQLHQGNPEYQKQRPSCEHMIGFARGMGIPVHIPPESDLCKTPRIYAYQADESFAAKKHAARGKELKQRHEEAITQIRNHKHQLQEWEKIAAKFEGAMEDNDYWGQRVSI